MAEAQLPKQLNDLLARFGAKKAEKEEEAPTTVKDFVRFDPNAIENKPRVEIRYQVFPSSFGSRELDVPKGEKPEKASIAEGVVPVISDIEKLQSLMKQLEYHSKKSEVLKYRRIKKQSDIVTNYRKEGRSDEEIDSLIQIFPVEYDLNITTVPFNIKEDDLFKKNFKVFINDLDCAEEFDKQLTIYRDEALNKLLEHKITHSTKELDNIR